MFFSLAVHLQLPVVNSVFFIQHGVRDHLDHALNCFSINHVVFLGLFFALLEAESTADWLFNIDRHATCG